MTSSTIRPLFFLGNKRSGTSHLVRLMNVHPSVFVTHESDAVWILYQAAQAQSFRRYPRDGGLGMRATLEACSSLLGPDPRATLDLVGVRELFFAIQRHLMEHGSSVQAPCPGRSPIWMGDKKPVQQADPVVLSFIATHFPDARYLHIVRDPRAVIASSERLTGTRRDQIGPDIVDDDGLRHRGGLPLSADSWASAEEWVEQAKRRGLPVHSLRFEDLTADPGPVMRAVFEFLEIRPADGQLQDMRAMTASAMNQKYADAPFEVSERARRIMEVFGYA